MAWLRFINKLFFSGHDRTVKANKNIAILIGVKGVAIITNLLIIPLTLNILGDYEYGIWIIIFNLLSWFQIFDIGLGNGLRNKLAESLSLKKYEEAKEYVSTTYVIMGLVTLGLILIFIIPLVFVEWASVLGAESSYEDVMFYVVGITFLFTAIQFWLKIITSIYAAVQKPAYSAVIFGVSNLVLLIVLYLFQDYFKGSILKIGIVFSLIPLIIFIGFNIFAFKNEFNSIKPEFSYFRRSKVPDLFNLGFKFFLIQIAVIIIFQTDTLIISNLIDPEAVTNYSITLKYFTLITTGFSVLMTPYWSAYTEAFALKDLKWIRKSLIKQFYFFLLFTSGALVLYFLAPFFMQIWIGEEFEINQRLAIYMTLFIIVALWNEIFSTILGGLSLLRLGTYVTICTAIINIPLSIYFVKSLNMGSAGVILATILCLLVTAIISPIQVYYFIFWKKQTDFLTQLLR